MKKLILGVTALLFLGLTSVNAQDAVKSEIKTTTQEQPQEEKVAIKQNQLPASVQEKLASKDFEGWRVASAFISKKDNTEIYIVELTNGKENATHKFDKEGNKIG